MVTNTGDISLWPLHLWHYKLFSCKKIILDFKAVPVSFQALIQTIPVDGVYEDTKLTVFFKNRSKYVELGFHLGDIAKN